MSSTLDDQKALGTPAAPATKSDKEEQRAAEDFGKDQATSQPRMKVKVHSPFREYYNGQAFSVSAENDTGPFDILPRHHNFISLLSPCDLIIRTVGKGEQRIRIAGGIMHVKADELIVFLDV